MTLRPNQTYYYRVKAISPEQESDYSETISVTTSSGSTSLYEPQPPSTPSILNSESLSDRIRIIFEPPNVEEVIEEVYLEVSTLSDFSNLIYRIPYVLDTNTSNFEYFSEPASVLDTPYLDPETLYYVRISYRNALGASGYATTSATTTSELDKPQVLGVSDLTAITATVLFTSIESATNHYVDVSTTSDFSSLVVNAADTSTDDFYQIPVLIENTKYYIRVRAFDGTNYSNYSETVSFTTLDNVETYDDLIYTLEPPQIRGVFNVFTDTARLEWYITNPTIDSYTVEYSTVSDFSSQVVSSSHVGNRAEFSSLLEDTLYYGRIRAVERGFSSEFTEFTFRTLSSNSLFTPPALLGLAVIKSTSLEVSWVQRTYATSYLLEYSTDSGFSSFSRVFTGNIGKLTLTDLSPATEYFMRVYAISGSGSSEASTANSYTTSAELPDITLLSPEGITPFKFTLNWTVNAEYDSYLVTVYKDNSEEIGSNSNNITYLGNGYYFLRDIGNTDSLLIDLFLEADSTYSYQIYGVTVDGDIKESEVGSVTTSSIEPFIQLNISGNILAWTGKLNRLIFSLDKDFKNQIPGLDPVSIDPEDSTFNIGLLAFYKEGFYVAGYFDNNGTRTKLSNIVDTSGVSSAIALIPSFRDTTATFRWKTEKTNDVRLKLLVDTGLGIEPVTGFNVPISIGPTRQYSVTGLSPDTDYFYSIQYLKQDTYTKLTPPVKFRTLKYASINSVTENTGIGTLTAPVISDKATTSLITFSDTFDRYIVEVYPNSTRVEPTAIYETTSNTIEVPVYTGKTTYFRFAGVDETASERTAPIESSTLVSKLTSSDDSPITTAPILNSSTILNDNEAEISWSEVVGATFYKLEISLSNTFNLLVKTVGIELIGDNKALISGLLGTQIYYVRVLAYNNKYISDYSNTVSVDTVP